ncbi:hypothetical protein Thini_2728 [Thiothrix nivea DSM 5205]|uniref:Uncharacterized protein n=2 Tax=Thiothrix nivea TaxID=1031 RepID=A0A656HJR8_THINJ|nr:hypothetical protein Thini_2728 [Thiothrix nivea DSM 5205]
MQTPTKGLTTMIATFNRLCGSILQSLSDALPVLLIAIFYQMTILEIPVHEIMGMLGWVLFISFGLTMIL